MVGMPLPQRWLLLAASVVLGLAAGGGWAWYQISSERSARASLPAPVPDPMASTTPEPAAIADLASPAALTTLLHEHPGTVLIDVHAQWCAPCALLAPRLVALAHAQPAIAIRGVDAGTASGFATQLAVDTLPTLIHFEHGVEVDRRSDAPTLSELSAWLAGTAAAPPGH